PVDAALSAAGGFSADGVSKLDEIPYDFSRRRLSVLLQEPDGTRLLVTKGAVREVLEICTAAEGWGDAAQATEWRARFTERAGALGEQGFRCLAVAVRKMEGGTTVD